MPTLVFVKVRWITKLSRAFLAFERTITSVNAHVYFQTTGTKKSLVTVFTPVLLLASVLQQV